jgi:endoglucanase
VEDYNDMSAVETGWLDGVENVTTPELIKRIKDAGFNAVRIPVTWYKMAGGDPDYTIREDWLNHVKSIVDMAVNQDMYVILNTHHDEYIMRFDEAEAGERAISSLWTQIGKKFRDYDEKLIFEGVNEPRRRSNSWNTGGNWDWSGNDKHYETLNSWSQSFVNAVRETGGNNQFRHLMLTTYAAQSFGQMNAFELPHDPIEGNGKDRFIMSVHVYSPHSWAHDGGGKYEGESAVKSDIERIAHRAYELGVPVILGEWGSVARNKHEERVQHAYDYIKVATEMRRHSAFPVVMACFVWDDHGNFKLVERAGPISEKSKEIISAMVKARKGEPLQ